MAYIMIFANREAISAMNRGTVISVDGGREFTALGSMYKYFKTASGDHSVVVTTGNGQSWECADYIGSRDVMNIRLDVGSDGNVVNVAYNVGAEPPGMMFMKKENLP